MEQADCERLYALFGEFPNVSTDSRRVDARTIFFALRGERFDGNRFAAGALDAGAAYAVIDDPEVAAQADAAHAGRLFVVDDTLKALQALAREHRRRLGIPILAITGSNGKTTTKELVTRVLAERYAVRATQGNLNNHIGVPLTLLSMTRDTELGIVEMGASACGEIALLASIAEPNYGIITNVGRAHLEGFGGEEGVRRGKGELYDFLAENGGRAFVRREDRTLVTMAAERGNLAVEFYDAAIADDADHCLEGSYNRLNVAAAMAIGRYFEVPEERIRHAIAAYVPSNNRSQRRETQRNTLIVDCYNANPSSMQVSLGNFLSEEFPGPKLALLGDMLELGAWSDEEHRRVIGQALAGNVERLWLVGRHFGAAWHGMAENDVRVRLFDSCEDAAAALQAEPVDGSLVLIKGSRGIGLERLIDLL
ncbi:UDP-N-acetylmuramoyl-tripeptide--D-alanyl-D-alanine ligase [uncultured Alistipes sp.]|uniref:UDP-N-acetylmuramoyl-tripeptide--D-alanyl-D- alanine ligase n=1 Tax=uncultured Alistipes sp. TaxID=538949 RepID=UPI002617CFB0|nr:UDP-N-acetylmuramoyl-tripeptide--D-alanyl-D-alanine ligase [uncultured Alistipes sp.]